MFVTLWVGILDLKTGALRFVSAGHNPPVVVNNGKAEFLKIKNGFVLAGMEGARYKEHTVTLNKGDLVFLYTDGVTEANAPDQELFGDDRLLSCFETTNTLSAGDVMKRIKAALDAFVQGNDPFDDVTMLCFRYLS